MSHCDPWEKIAVLKYRGEFVMFAVSECLLYFGSFLQSGEPMSDQVNIQRKGKRVREIREVERER